MNPNQKQIAGISLNIIEPRAEMGEKKDAVQYQNKTTYQISKYHGILSQQNY